MSRINILDTKTANAIKAGEVIDRPQSVVKELLDNAIDSGATHIKIEFSGGGIALIRVTDDGCGMDEEDAQKAFLIHATSKLHKIEDLFDLSTMGFRGEALASIAACSDVTLVTSQEGEDGVKVEYVDGEFKGISKINSARGTIVEVRSLFKNFPARYKFLKKDSTEGMYITGMVEKLAVVNPDISIKLIKDGQQMFTTPGTGSMLDAIYAVYGKETAQSLIEVDTELEGNKVKGFAGRTDFVRGNRGLQCVYVNNRLIHSKTVTAAIDEAYKNAVMKNKYPVCFLCIYPKNGSVDVNVHPQKAEVKFANDSDIFRLVFYGIRNSVFEAGRAGQDFFGSTEEVKPEIKEETGKQLKMDFVKTQVRNPARSEIEPSGTTEDANRLLKVLSGFKPDISSVSEDKPVYVQEPVIADPDVKKDDITLLSNAEFIGIIFTTYIIMQSDEDIFFVDQHAAHERVMYERFMAKKKPGVKVTDTQTLLVPQVIKVSASDYDFISSSLNEFNDNGFEIELLGDREIALRSIPMDSKTKPSQMFSDILVDLKRDVPARSDIWYSLIQTTACKAAVRAGDVITKEQALAIIEQLSHMDDPYHCAHGRPTFFKISKKDFEKNFKRIV
ncbi:MAG: DNA mismatch repair endonuclease MutL [Saccharofermentans sp.]|nr:DNA mismatch repair endonuclease MutL [Saccharofermentans sp.]